MPGILPMLMAAMAVSFTSPTEIAAALASETAGGDNGVLRLPELQCLIGGNGEAGNHRAGYNGVFSLVSADREENPFVPLYAGLNLEHYFDAAPVPKNDAVFFEPRRNPMKFTQVDERTAELYQAATPVYGVESRTRFTLTSPHYLDMQFRCTPSHASLEGGILGIFWASYINAPEDKSMYFLGEGASLDAPRWVQYCTLEHGRDSTVCSASDPNDITFKEGARALFTDIAPIRYSEPFFYGRVRDRVLIYIFRPGPCIRFSHSPSGGGQTPEGTAQNPAWDFQLLIPKVIPGTEYGMEMRLVYKKWAGREDVLNEVRTYLPGDTSR